ncbi:hypothetical protein [Actinoallomurus sp. CA-150999]|uniref:hypothetical protein n=1 Tax=Actinoallomurus sp. CA-150999 TaxID=3239887 RepID=UPI003D8DD96B
MGYSVRATMPCVGLLVAAITSCGSHTPSAKPTSLGSPQEIVARSATALSHIRQVTVSWDYQGYKGTASSGRLVVTPTGSRPIGRHLPREAPPPHATLGELVKAVQSVTDFGCPPLANAHAHLTRGSDTTLHGTRVVQLTTGINGEVVLIANLNPPALPQEVDLCGTGPFQAEAGDTRIVFADYHP